MQREWWNVGDLNFIQEDAAFLIIPEESHGAARIFFDDAEREYIGPNYKCPFIDPYWDPQNLKTTLKAP
ncbi:hypothetical protein BST65_27200 [Bradyrhizobium canariense]|nr:hypothetical protein BST65_27200 [Bradyrhizobium canariense]OSI26900.1 hypothetical protein BST66_36765 [Bradyrhizobium canariense]OSI39349.1 hypothetical protein BSZ20_30190 [Bradyrhizobium canariense]OSI45780.1 hypothetical protein BST67_25775 [Bradyrhizobium canariense]OSI55460.1 hypothetical protein BSZ15_19610 [Bradyrhizobium canariense]